MEKRQKKNTLVTKIVSFTSKEYKIISFKVHLKKKKRRVAANLLSVGCIRVYMSFSSEEVYLKNTRFMALDFNLNCHKM